MTTKETQPKPPEHPLFPIETTVLTESFTEILLNKDSTYKVEYSELWVKQPTIIKLLSHYGGFFDSKNDGEDAKAFYEGAAYAYRIFRNQAKFYGQEPAIIPENIEETVNAAIRAEKDRTKDKSDEFPDELIIEHLVKARQEELHEILVNLTYTGEFRDLRLKGALITALAFMTYQEILEFNRQIDIEI